MHILCSPYKAFCPYALDLVIRNEYDGLKVLSNIRCMLQTVGAKEDFSYRIQSHFPK